VKKLRTANQRVRYLSNAEEDALFKALRGQDWVKNIIVMAINTGMRRGELFDLKWFDVDFNRRIVHVRQSKSGRPRVIPLNSTAQTLLKGLPKTSEYVFPSPKNEKRRVNDVGRHSAVIMGEASVEITAKRLTRIERNSLVCKPGYEQ